MESAPFQFHIIATMKYIYYKIFQSFRRIKTNDTPATNAMLLISGIECVNILTLLLVFNHFLNTKLNFNAKNEILLYPSILCVVIFTHNYFLLYKKREEICERYKNENKTHSRIGFVFLLIYIIGSFVFVYFIGTTFPLYLLQK